RDGCFTTWSRRRRAGVSTTLSAATPTCAPRRKPTSRLRLRRERAVCPPALQPALAPFLSRSSTDRPARDIAALSLIHPSPSHAKLLSSRRGRVSKAPRRRERGRRGVPLSGHP